MNFYSFILKWILFSKNQDFTIQVDSNLISKPYVGITLRLIRLFGLKIIENKNNIFWINSNKISENKSPDKFDPEDETQKLIINQIKKLFKNRADNIDPNESINTQNNVNELFDEWLLYTTLHKGYLQYGENPFENKDQTKADQLVYLLKDDLRSSNQLISVPHSFRDAESELNLFYEKMDVTHEWKYW